MKNTLYTLRTKEALEFLQQNNIAITNEKTLKRRREAGKLSAQTRPDETNNFRDTVFYNPDELLKVFGTEPETTHEPVLDNLTEESLMKLPDLGKALAAFAGIAQALQQNQTTNESINEKVLNLSEAVKESGLTRKHIKSAAEEGKIIARKGKTRKQMFKGKEYDVTPMLISKVSLLQYAHAWLREETELTAKAAKA